MFFTFFGRAIKQGRRAALGGMRKCSSSSRYFTINHSRYFIGAASVATVVSYDQKKIPAQTQNKMQNNNNKNVKKNNQQEKQQPKDNNSSLLDSWGQFAKMAQSTKDKIFQNVIRQFYDSNNDDEMIKNGKQIIEKSKINFKNNVIIDVGMNGGLFAPILIEKLGNSNGTIISIGISNGSKLNLSSNLKGKVDTIIISNAFHYLDNAPQLLDEINEYLKSNGKLIVVDIKEGHFHLPSFVYNLLNSINNKENDDENKNENEDDDSSSQKQKQKQKQDKKVNSKEPKNTNLAQNSKHNTQTKQKSNDDDDNNNDNDDDNKEENDKKTIKIIIKIKVIIKKNQKVKKKIDKNVEIFIQKMKEQNKNLIAKIQKEVNIPKEKLQEIEKMMNDMINNIQMYIKENDIHNVKDIISTIEKEIKTLLTKLEKEIKDNKMMNKIKQIINDSKENIMKLTNNKENNKTSDKDKKQKKDDDDDDDNNNDDGDNKNKMKNKDNNEKEDKNKNKNKMEKKRRKTK